MTLMDGFLLATVGLVVWGFVLAILLWVLARLREATRQAGRLGRTKPADLQSEDGGESGGRSFDENVIRELVGDSPPVAKRVYEDRFTDEPEGKAASLPDLAMMADSTQDGVETLGEFVRFGAQLGNGQPAAMGFGARFLQAVQQRPSHLQGGRDGVGQSLHAVEQRPGMRPNLRLEGVGHNPATGPGDIMPSKVGEA